MYLKLCSLIHTDGMPELCYRCSYYVHDGGTVVGSVDCTDPFFESLETRQLAMTCDGMCVVSFLI